MNPFALSKWQMLFDNLDLFFHGVAMTLLYSAFGLLAAFLVGLVLALFAVGRFPALRAVNKIMVKSAQNIPVVIFIFFMYNGLPMIGVVMSVFQIGVIGIGIYQGAYISETMRAGIEAVPRAQFETAESQGFHYFQMMRLIILPQMFWSILPSLTNNVVNFIISTSTMAMIAGGEIMYTADSWSSYNMAYGPAYLFTALTYFTICYPLSCLVKRMEQGRGGIRIEHF